MTCSDTAPGATRPGQRTIAGMRMPPSSSSCFMPENGHTLENRSPAIVASEDDNGVAGETARVERPQHASDIVVQTLHHRGVGFLRTAIAVHNVPDALRLCLVLRPFPWPMRCGEMQTQQKWLIRLGVAFNGLHGSIAEQVCHVAVTLNRYLLLVELIGKSGER